MLTVYLTTSTNQLYKLSLKTINVELIKSLKKQIILLVVYQSFLKDFFVKFQFGFDLISFLFRP